MNFENIFKNLFVLELANNHLGSLQRGIKIINDHAKIVRYNNVKAAIKLQFRDVTNFIHPNFKKNQEIRYINADPPVSLDFLARAAKNYDCRFNVTANDAALTYKILSGSINITVSHSKMFLVNLESEYPVYSPQGYQISGSFKIQANNWNDLL